MCRSPDDDVESKLKPVTFATTAVNDLLDNGNAAAPTLLFDASVVPLVEGETICDVVTQVGHGTPLPSTVCLSSAVGSLVKSCARPHIVPVCCVPPCSPRSTRG